MRYEYSLLPSRVVTFEQCGLPIWKVKARKKVKSILFRKNTCFYLSFSIIVRGEKNKSNLNVLRRVWAISRHVSVGCVSRSRLKPAVEKKGIVCKGTWTNNNYSNKRATRPWQLFLLHSRIVARGEDNARSQSRR